MRTNLALAVGLFLVLCGMRLAAQENPAKVEWTLPSARMALEPGKGVELFVSVLDAAGQKVPGIKPRLDASAGSFEDPIEQAPGRYRAIYRMPTARYPQAVILAAKVPGLPPSWTVLSLSARTELPVDADKPSVMVTLTVGGRSFGPVRTDDRGRVRIPVEIGPADSEAVAEAVDEFGNRSKRRVAIPIPPTGALVGFAERSELAADGEDSSELYLVSIEPDGSPAEHRTFLASKTTGTISGVRQKAPGLYVLRYVAPKGLSKPQATVSVMAKDAPQLSKRSFPFRFLAGRPARLGLSIEPAALVADGKSNARLKLAITDKGGNPLSGLSPRMYCESGSLTEVKDIGGGNFEAIYTAPARRAGEVVCQAALDLGDQPTLKNQTRLSLSLPVPASLQVTCDRETLLLDGRSRAAIEVRVADARGDPLEGVSLRTEVPLGTLGSIIEDGGGRYHLVYTAPKGTTPTRVMIALAAGAAGGPQTQVMLNLEPVPVPPPEAPWLATGAAGTVTTNFSRMLYGGMRVEAVLKMPFLREALYLGLESGYRGGEQSDPTLVPGLEVTTRIEVIPIHAWVIARFMPHTVISPLFGVGGGADLVQWSVSATGGQRERGYRLTWGVAAGAGVDYRLGPGALSLWLRYHYAYLSAEGPIAQQSAGSASLLKGSVGGLETSLGYALFF